MTFGTTYPGTKFTRRSGPVFGLKNGLLLQHAESAGNEVLITVDQGLRYQQNLAQRKISILMIRSRTNQMEDLVPLAGSVLSALAGTGPGQVSVAT